jgi:large subunit ribosomal protein L11
MSKAGKMKAAAAKIRHFQFGLRTNIPAQLAVAGPPLGTQLGTMGINISAFVKDFNLRTSVFREGVPLPTRTTVNADRSYNLTIHHPTATYFLKQAAGVQRGAQFPGREVTGYITRKHLYEIAKIKSEDPPLQMVDLEEVCRLLIDSAYSLGIRVVDSIDAEEYQQFLADRAQVVETQKKDLQEAKEAKLLRTA